MSDGKFFWIVFSVYRLAVKGFLCSFWREFMVMHLSLSNLAIVMGAIMAAINFLGLVNPSAFTTMARKLPRSTFWGGLLVLLSTAWFIQNLKQESIAEFESLKPALYTLFVAVGVGTCIFVRDLLGARGVGVFLLLLGKLMVDTARWVDTPWRLVIVCWAYVFVIAGMWFTIYPWHFRDLIYFGTASPKRTRFLGGLKTAFGIFVIILGVMVY